MNLREESKIKRDKNFSILVEDTLKRKD